MALRRSPMQRGEGTLARTPMRKKRKPAAVVAARFERVYGGAERADWMTLQPCILGCPAPSVNAHVKTGGTSRKADARWIVPACAAHHDEMHHGQQSFEAKYGVDLEALAHVYDARWEAYAARAGLTPTESPE